jgi:hypothetical protein
MSLDAIGLELRSMRSGVLPADRTVGVHWTAESLEDLLKQKHSGSEVHAGTQERHRRLFQVLDGLWGTDALTVGPIKPDIWVDTSIRELSVSRIGKPLLLVRSEQSEAAEADEAGVYGIAAQLTGIGRVGIVGSVDGQPTISSEPPEHPSEGVLEIVNYHSWLNTTRQIVGGLGLSFPDLEQPAAQL